MSVEEKTAENKGKEGYNASNVSQIMPVFLGSAVLTANEFSDSSILSTPEIDPNSNTLVMPNYFEMIDRVSEALTNPAIPYSEAIRPAVGVAWITVSYGFLAAAAFGGLKEIYGAHKDSTRWSKVADEKHGQRELGTDSLRRFRFNQIAMNAQTMVAGGIVGAATTIDKLQGKPVLAAVAVTLGTAGYFAIKSTQRYRELRRLANG